MTNKERLAEMLRGAGLGFYGMSHTSEDPLESGAEYLLQHGVTLPQEPENEPTPTEMVKRLLEKGWTLKPGRDMHDLCLEDPKTNILYSFIEIDIEKAYRHAFPRKKRITVDVWANKFSGEWNVKSQTRTSYIGDEKGNMSTPESLIEAGWIPGTATFEVPEEG